jgi:predicted SprT family Zn-dependent metalloprotease
VSRRGRSLAPELREWLEKWAQTWSVPELPERCTVRFDRRLRRSLGRCLPERLELKLAQWLETGPEALLREVLCHEAAHAAVHLLHGAGVRPHGREWRALMRAAGFEPRTRLPQADLPAHLAVQARAATPWQHLCPICHATRRARRPMPHWRCRTCLAARLDGRLVIRHEHGAR